MRYNGYEWDKIYIEIIRKDFMKWNKIVYFKIFIIRFLVSYIYLIRDIELIEFV